MVQHVLQRTIFETSRAIEYFDYRELQAQTGQQKHNFATVALKELFDNALDACETAGVPPQIEVQVAIEGGLIHLAVADNAGGIAPRTVKRILNFATRTSDKAAYRAPTRGAQGNALKTIIGMPCALGSSRPVVIESKGVRHSIQAGIDPAGEVQIDAVTAPIKKGAGTVVSLCIPSEEQQFDPSAWMQAYALFNPHALVKIEPRPRGSELAHFSKDEEPIFYQPLVDWPGNWKKFLPSDPTSPYWYTLHNLERLVFSHIGALKRGGTDLLLRDFVRQFRGLSGTQKAKQVCAQLPNISHLSDFEERKEQIEVLLSAMRAATKPAKPAVFGEIGEEQFRKRFEEWYKVTRFWYAKKAGEENGEPFVFEAAIAETERDHAFFNGVNFSPTFEDPLAGTRLESKDVGGYGIQGFLHAAHVLPGFYGYRKTPPFVVAVHLSYLPEHLDRGKTRIRVNRGIANEISAVLWRVAKELYREEEQRNKDAARAERAAQERVRRRNQRHKWTQKDAVFAVLPEALNITTGGGVHRVSRKQLHYHVRRLIQRYGVYKLEYGYFSDTILLDWRDSHGPIKELYNDPRGVLYEPHTGRAIPLGTQEVEKYQFPSWLYNKILYIEKKGFWPVLQAVRFAERYDMAVIAAEGYATVAVRTLFEAADKNQNYQLFVLHDADPAGYNIARTLKEGTRRMPDYSVEVIDLGLHLEEALEMGLEVEEFTRQAAIPQDLELTELEQEYFEGEKAGKKSWICKRVELNAMTSPQFVEFCERRLSEAGAVGKVLPDEKHMAATLEEQVRAKIEYLVKASILRSARIEEQVQAVLQTTESVVGEALEAGAQEIHSRVRENLSKTPEERWMHTIERVSGRMATDILKQEGMRRREIPISTE